MATVTYVIPYRKAADPGRYENLLAVCRWIAHLGDVETIVVEQDAQPTLPADFLEGKAKTVFAWNPGGFNRGWGFNVGAIHASSPILALGDGDVISHGGFQRSVDLLRQGHDAVKPYRKLFDLTVQETMQVRAGQWDLVPARPAGAVTGRFAQGEKVNFCGGLFLIQRDVFLRLAGFDERFRGWGGEDNAMAVKLGRAKLRGADVDAAALHLWHPRPRETTFGQPDYLANKKLAAEYLRYSDTDLQKLYEETRAGIGNPDKYR